MKNIRGDIVWVTGRNESRLGMVLTRVRRNGKVTVRVAGELVIQVHISRIRRETHPEISRYAHRKLMRPAG